MRNGHFNVKYKSYLDEIVRRADSIQKKANKEKTRFNVYALIQRLSNKNTHPLALIYILTQLDGAWDSIRSKWAWCESVFAKKNGTYNERESARENEKYKNELNQAPDNVKRLIGGMFQ